MIPDFEKNGNLPPDIYEAFWDEFCERFGFTKHRQWLINGLQKALKTLSYAGCDIVYINGSFVTAKKKNQTIMTCVGASTLLYLNF